MIYRTESAWIGKEKLQNRAVAESQLPNRAELLSLVLSRSIRPGRTVPPPHVPGLGLWSRF